MDFASITTSLAPLAVLACPIGMGAMMWVMARSGKNRTPREDVEAPRASQPGSLELLRHEHERLGDEIARLEHQQVDSVGSKVRA